MSVGKRDPVRKSHGHGKRKPSPEQQYHKHLNEAADELLSKGQSKANPDPFARALDQSPQYWLKNSPDLLGMEADQLLDEANKITEYLERQTKSSVDDTRLARVRDGFLGLAERRRENAMKPAAKPKKGAKLSAPPPDQKPRFIREQSSRKIESPDELRAEYRDIENYLQRGDVPAVERRILQAELANLDSRMGAVLMDQSAGRQSERLETALNEGVGTGNGSIDLVNAVRNIESFQAVEEEPGMYAITHKGERLMVSADQLRAIRHAALEGMADISKKIHGRNDQLQMEYEDFVKLNFEDHKYVGFFVMLFSWENPSNWRETIMEHVVGANGPASAVKEAAADPWRSDFEPLLPMAMNLGEGLGHLETGVTYFESKRDNMISTAGDIVTGLEITKKVGGVAATVAFSPAGNALYNGISSVGTQAMEMHYGQRDSMDWFDVGADMASGYVAGKISRGVGTRFGGGIGAPAWQRGLSYVAGDRLGAAAYTTTRMGLDNIADRTNHSASSIFGAAFDSATDYKDLAMSFLMGKASGRMRQQRVGRDAAPPKRTLPPPKTPKVDEKAPDAGSTLSGGASLKLVPPVTDNSTASPPANQSIVVPQGITRKDHAANKRVPPKVEGSMPAGRAMNDNDSGAIPINRAKQHVPVAQQQQTQLQGKIAVGQTGGVVPLGGQQPTVMATKSGGGSGSKASVGNVSTSGSGGGGKVLQLPQLTNKAHKKAKTQNKKDPLVTARVGGDADTKGRYWEVGSKALADHQKKNQKKDSNSGNVFTTLPRSQAESLGFKSVDAKKSKSKIKPTTAGDVRKANQDPIKRDDPVSKQQQRADKRPVESTGASPDAKHPVTARANAGQKNPDEVLQRITSADSAQANAYKQLMTQGEYGIRRPTNVSTGGVDFVTVKVKGNKAYIYLNDSTGMKAPKGGKKTHQDWAKKAREHLTPDRLNVGNQKVEAMIRKAWNEGRIYVRTIRGDGSGAMSVETPVKLKVADKKPIRGRRK